MFKLLKTEDKARRGEFTCPHGTVQTPVFMNVGTQAAIKGALSAEDLEHIGTQVELSNTYHLHLRPGDEVVKKMGGLHKFMTWNGPILTDSGGVQREAFFAGKKCVTVLDFEVWPETMRDGRNVLAKPCCEDILTKLGQEQYLDPAYHPFGDGHSAEKMCQIINTVFRGVKK